MSTLHVFFLLERFQPFTNPTPNLWEMINEMILKFISLFQLSHPNLHVSSPVFTLFLTLILCVPVTHWGVLRCSIHWDFYPHSSTDDVQFRLLPSFVQHVCWSKLIVRRMVRSFFEDYMLLTLRLKGGTCPTKNDPPSRLSLVLGRGAPQHAFTLKNQLPRDWPCRRFFEYIGFKNAEHQMRLTIKMRKPRGNPFEMLGQNKKSSINANPSLFGRLYEMPRLNKYPYHTRMVYGNICSYQMPLPQKCGDSRQNPTSILDKNIPPFI